VGTCKLWCELQHLNLSELKMAKSSSDKVGATFFWGYILVYCCIVLPYYLGTFDTNYIIFRNVKKIGLKKKKNTNLWSEILNLREFFLKKMKISKLSNYLRNMCWSCQGITILVLFYSSLIWRTTNKLVPNSTQHFIPNVTWMVSYKFWKALQNVWKLRQMTKKIT
jgi:hypothetical protein